MKQILLKVISLFIVLGLLTGCSGKNDSVSSKENKSKVVSESFNASEGKLDPKNPTKVKFYSYSLTYPTMKAGMEHLINSFNETIGKEKGVIVEGIADESMTLFQTDIAAGQQVDIVQHAFSTLDYSRKNLGFNAYEDIFPEDKLQEHFSTMYPNALKLGEIDDKTYGLAFTFSTPILYMNGKLFKEAGLDTSKPPKNWDEVLEYAKKSRKLQGKMDLDLPLTMDGPVMD